MHATQRIVATAICLALCSCSLTMRSPPPNYAGEVAPGCDDSDRLPTLDMVAAAGPLAIGAIMLLVGIADANSTDRGTRLGIGAGGLAIGGAFTASAVTGFRRASSCRKAVAVWSAGEPQRMVAACTAREAQLRARAAAEVSKLASSDAAAVQQTCTSCTADPADAVQSCSATTGLRAFRCDAYKPCVETDESKERQVAIDRLSLETNCERKTIELVSQAEWRAGTETAFRLRACGAEYVCTVAAGRVSCKSALVGG